MLSLSLSLSGFFATLLVWLQASKVVVIKSKVEQCHHCLDATAWKGTSEAIVAYFENPQSPKHLDAGGWKHS
eukprot:411010-Amphidinium_carterae.1